MTEVGEPVDKNGILLSVLYSDGILGRELLVLEGLGVVGEGVQTRPLNRKDLLILWELNGKSFEFLNLQSLDLSGIDIRGLSIERATLDGVNLENAVGKPLLSKWGKDLTPQDLVYETELTHWEKEEETHYDEITTTSLSGSFLSGANLSKSDLRWVDLSDVFLIGANLEGAFLYGADLSQAFLRGARIEGTSLRKAVLTGVHLENANVKDADLREVDLSGAHLLGTRIDTPLLGGIKWHDRKVVPEEESRDFLDAVQVYVSLKQAHLNAGEYATAGGFHYREFECRRKLAQQEWKLPPDVQGWRRKLAHKYNMAKQISQLWLYRLASGYGELPGRVLWAGAGVIAFFALWYFPYSGLPCFQAGCWAPLWEGIWQSLYFSGVSFTALGYGDFATAPNGWTRYLGMVESLVGISLIALFLVTFTRKMTR